MKRMKATKIAALAAALMLALGLMVGCSGDNSSDGDYKLIQDGKLTVAASCDFPPFETLDGDTPTGYGIAVIQEVANRLGLECEIKNTTFDTIVPAVAGGEQFDVGVSSITIDPEREEQVDFSDPYYIADQSIVVRAGSYASVEELEGKTIAAQSGTTGYEYALENVSDDVVGYTEATACFAALQSGNCEAVAIDLPVSESMIAQAYPDCEILERVATGEEYGIAINKDNTALTEAINKILAEMEEDGTLEKLEAEYLG